MTFGTPKELIQSFRITHYELLSENDYKGHQRKTLVVDIDGTLCSSPEKGDYGNCDVINEVCEKLNEEDQKGSMYRRDSGVSEKIPLVNFQSESILILKKRNGNVTLAFDISRLDGSIIRQVSFFGGTMILEAKGSCKKAEPKKTLF